MMRIWSRQFHFILTALFSISLALASFSSSAEAASKADFVGGAKAITALGTKIAKVAKANHKTTGQLRKMFRQDSTLKVNLKDPKLTLAYFEKPLPKDAIADSAADTFVAAAIPLTDTFKLHSRPGAKRVIFIDFDGHYMQNNAWTAGYNDGSPIDAPAFDTDGNPAAFSDSELTIIQQVWQRVSEDYAPFDVDVTTEFTGEDAITRSSSSDEYYGTRALVSPISSYFGNYGGIAYIRIYDGVGDLGDYYKPALIFPEKLSKNAKNIAEAVSHEVGHNLNLYHDGTSTAGYYQGHGSGETGWAPIMGVGYYKNLVQWSKGEYPDANNTEDDLSIIAGYLGYRTDDVGDTIAAAASFTGDSSLTGNGVISKSTDIDMFRFATDAGTISISVKGADLGTNLDILADLYDQSGQKIASANPVDLLSATISASVPKGIYFLAISGTGKGDLITGYSNYGSLGQYSIAATVIPPTGGFNPVAIADASPASGEAPLAVQFSGARSYDSDGNIITYDWDFGDGTTGTGSPVSHTYSAAGAYTASLVVTDNTGLQGATTVDVNVLAANVLPVAAISADPVSGYAPLTVSFDGSGSTDSDGTIASYAWSFGDGATATGAAVQHTFTSIGSFIVKLTVTDNRGGTGTTTTTIQTLQDPAKVIRVSALSMKIVTVSRNKTAEVTVTITDINNNPVAGAVVTGAFTGVVTGSASATSSTSGTAIIKSKKISKAGTVTFTVKSVTPPSGYIYQASSNLVNSVSVTAPK